MINKLHISGFRSFKDLTVEGLGRVNLITGRNNVGKSTLLEAVRLWVTDGAVQTFASILSSREEISQRAGEFERTLVDSNNFTAFNRLFNGYPTPTQNSRAFSVAGGNGDHLEELTVAIGWQHPRPNSQGKLSFEPPDHDQHAKEPKLPVLETRASRRRASLLLDYVWSELRRTDDFLEPGRVPCLFLDPFSSRSTGQLASLWDKVALTDGADDVVRALQIISKDIQAVTMIGDPPQRLRIAMARSHLYEQPVPLKSFGDGVNRVFGLILSLTCAKGGYLLVDEIENGLHHSSLTGAFRAIFKLASELDVQVFATTHSRDCIEAFQKAAEESPDDGALVRLTHKDDKIFSTVLREKQLKIVAEDQIEVR